MHDDSLPRRIRNLRRPDLISVPDGPPGLPSAFRVRHSWGQTEYKTSGVGMHNLPKDQGLLGLLCTSTIPWLLWSAYCLSSVTPEQGTGIVGMTSRVAMTGGST